MRRYSFLVFIFVLVMLSGCNKDIPEPENKMTIKSVNHFELSYDVPVFGIETNNREPFHVKHQVKGKDLLVECIVQGVSFRSQSKNKKGKILLYVDGKKKDEILSAAFIVKDLSAGTHRIKLEVVKENNSPYNLKKEFYVTIP